MSGLTTASATSPNNSSDPKTVTATCPGGTSAIAGGYNLSIQSAIGVSDFRRSGTTQWTATAFEAASTSANWTLTVVVTCAAVS